MYVSEDYPLCQEMYTACSNHSEMNGCMKPYNITSDMGLEIAHKYVSCSKTIYNEAI